MACVVDPQLTYILPRVTHGDLRVGVAICGIAGSSRDLARDEQVGSRNRAGGQHLPDVLLVAVVVRRVDPAAAGGQPRRQPDRRLAAAARKPFRMLPRPLCAPV